MRGREAFLFPDIIPLLENKRSKDISISNDANGTRLVRIGNFCVDSPDYAIGNARELTIAEWWGGPRAEAFRKYRRRRPLAVRAASGRSTWRRSGGNRIDKDFEQQNSPLIPYNNR